MQLCEQALKLNPNFGRAYYQRGMIYEKQEKYDKAVEDLIKGQEPGVWDRPGLHRTDEEKGGGQEVEASPVPWSLAG